MAAATIVPLKKEGILHEDGILVEVNCQSAPDLPKQGLEHRQSFAGLFERTMQSYLNNYVMLVMTASASLTLSGICIKVITADVSLYQALAIRSVLCLIILGGTCRWRGYRIVESRELLPLCIIRGAAGAAAFLCWAFATYALPLSEAAFMTNSYPVVTALLSWSMGMEHLSFYSWAGVLGCVIGNALVAHPAVIFGGQADWGMKRVLGLAVSAFGNILMGSTFVIIRHIGKRVSSLVLSFYMHLFVLLVCIPFLIVGYPKALSTRHSLTVLVFYGGAWVTALVTQYTMTRALQVGPPTKATALRLVNTIASGLVGVCILGETVSWISAIGSVVIVVSVLTVVLQRSRNDDCTQLENDQEHVLLTDRDEET